MPVLPIAPGLVHTSVPLRVPAVNTDLPPNYDDVVGSSRSSSSASSLSSSPSASGSSSYSGSPPRRGLQVTQVDNAARPLLQAGTVYQLGQPNQEERHVEICSASGALPLEVVQEMERVIEDRRRTGAMPVPARLDLRSLQHARQPQAEQPSMYSLMMIGSGLHDDDPEPEVIPAPVVRRNEKTSKHLAARLKLEDKISQKQLALLKRVRDLEAQRQKLPPLVKQPSISRPN